MASSPNKRRRESEQLEAVPASQAPAPPDAAALRTTLLARLDATPPFWADVAARLGVSGADPCLCSLGRELAGSLRAVQEAAEVARQRLQALRATLHAAVDARVDELLAKVCAAESAKASALERELERLDEVLERMRREHAAVREVIASKGEGDELTAARCAELSCRMDGIDTLLASLPHGPVEPSLLRVDVDDGTLLAALRTAVVLLAPRGLRPADIFVRGLPACVRPGRPLVFELALCDDYSSRAPAELEAAAASLAFHVRVSVSLVRGTGSQQQQLEATLERASTSSCVAVSIIIPVCASRGDEIVLRNLTYAGQTMPGLALAVRLRVITGMLAPLRLEGAANGYWSTPLITPDGTLFAPMYGRSEVLAFAADGPPLPPLPVAALGLSTRTCTAAFDAVTGTLLLADDNGSFSKLVAVDAATEAVRWSAAVGGGCRGATVLPAQGVAVASDYDGDKLLVFRLSDGVRVATFATKDPVYMASDPAAGTVRLGLGQYASTRKEVTAFRWDGTALNPEGVVEAAGKADNWRPLAVVPPAPGLRTSHLVVGTCCTTTLRILSLPDRHLVHTHELEGMQVSGLAGDPSGSALAVCDAVSGAIHVLSWPLPGMPPLQ